MQGLFRMDKGMHERSGLALPDSRLHPAFRNNYAPGRFYGSFNNIVTVKNEGQAFMAYAEDEIFPSDLFPTFPVRPLSKLVSGSKNGIDCIARFSGKQGQMADNEENWIERLVADFRILKAVANRIPYTEVELRKRSYNCLFFDNSVDLSSPFKSVIAFRGIADIPLYYGVDSECSCTVSDVGEIMRENCLRSYRAIPQGVGILIPVATMPLGFLSIGTATNSDA